MTVLVFTDGVHVAVYAFMNSIAVTPNNSLGDKTKFTKNL